MLKIDDIAIALESDPSLSALTLTNRNTLALIGRLVYQGSHSNLIFEDTTLSEEQMESLTDVCMEAISVYLSDPEALAPVPRDRYAIYARVATVYQDRETVDLQAQIRECERAARSHGGKVVALFEDTGYSARDNNRPGLRRMLDWADTNAFDVLVVYSQDRLFRDELGVKNIQARLKTLGIQIKFLAEPIS